MKRVALALLLFGCHEAPTCGGAALAPLTEAPTYAVVSSDYASTAIALLDGRGALLDEAWLDSGTAPPGIVATLSGDVSLPGAPYDGCTLVLIDRLGTNVVTFLDVCGGEIVRAQVPTGQDTNPQDVLQVDGRAWISRFGRGADGGDDIAVLDVDAGRVIDTVDLSALAGELGRVHPGRMARLTREGTERVLLGAARLANDFMEASTGAVGMIDPDTREVSLLSLEPLRNCAEVDAVPGAPDRALVTCGGPTFAPHEMRRPHAGLVLLELAEDGEARELGRYAAADHPELPVPYLGAVSLGDGNAFCAASGDVGGDVDRGLRVNLLTGEAEVVLAAADAYVIGEGAHSAEPGLLLVPDAAAGAVRRIEEGVEGEPVATAGCRGLPPREIARLR